MPTTSFHDPDNIPVTNNNRRYSPARTSRKFCCPGDDETRSFSAFPVSTTMCILLQAMSLAGLVAGTVTAYWRMKQWSINDFTYRRFWGLWQTCTRIYAEHGLRLRSQKCYSRFQHASDESGTVDGRLVLREEDYLDEWEMTCLALMVFACVHALIGLLLHVVCCLRSPCCLCVWAAKGIFICGSACVVYFSHFVQAREEHSRLQNPRIQEKFQETLELGWSFYLAVASMCCQTLLIGAMIAFCIYAQKRRRGSATGQQQQAPHYRSRESVV